MKEENKKENMPDDFTKKQIEDIKAEIDKSEETIRDLTNDERYKAYFEQFTPDSVKDFINYYAFYKSQLYRMGPFYKELEVNKPLKFKKEAREYLKLIQEEKLVRLQFEWNKENMVIEGIECNPDFYYYYTNEFECPFLSPVTKEEVDDLYAFLLSDEFYCADYRSEQAYEFLFGEISREFEDIYNKDDDDQGEGLHKYHYFLMKRHDLPSLSRESMIRAKKENVYINFGKDELRKKYRELDEEMKKNPRKDIDHRPRIYYHDNETMRKFITAFEEPNQLKYYDVIYRFDKQGDDHRTDAAIDYLEKIKEQVTIQANDNWRTAIIEAAEKNKLEKTAKALYLAFEDYLKHIETKKTPFIKNENPKQSAMSSRGYYRTHLLRGRELASEPRDFNF